MSRPRGDSFEQFAVVSHGRHVLELMAPATGAELFGRSVPWYNQSEQLGESYHKATMTEWGVNIQNTYMENTQKISDGSISIGDTNGYQLSGIYQLFRCSSEW